MSEDFIAAANSYPHLRLPVAHARLQFIQLQYGRYFALEAVLALGLRVLLSHLETVVV
jgi:hypothetical protein